MGSPRTAGEAGGLSSTFEFDALGTQWEIATREPLGHPLEERVLGRIDQFDRTYSRFRSDSLVARIATAEDGGCFVFPEDSRALFDLYDQLHRATAGAIDPFVGRRLELLGYDAAYSLTPAPRAARAAEASARPNWSRDVGREGRKLITRRAVVIDVGAAGKGYAVDIVAEVLRAAGVTEYVVDASGDLRHAGLSPIPVGLEHPFDRTLLIGVSDLRGGALCASATNRRAWANGLHHILDARTGLPVDDVVATWVAADDAATADGLATALFVADASTLAETFSFAFVRMFADGRVEVSENFEGEIFVGDRPREDGWRPSKRTNGRVRAGSRATRSAVAAIAAAAVMAGCASAATNRTSSPTAATTQTGSRSAIGRSTYRDGVYTATGQYGSLPSSITVRLRLKNGVIKTVRVTPHATDPTSLALQRRFAAAVPAVVVGKPIAKVHVGRLAGSSGTPDGFNAAIEEIKKQARKAR